MLKLQDQQFLINQQQINSYYSHKYKNNITYMAQLRTSFIQTCNNTSSLFSSMTGIMSSIGSLFNNDDKDDTKNIQTKQDKCISKKYHSLAFGRYQKAFNNDLHKSLHNFINLNINSLSQLMDKQNNDFKGHDNFIHVLQLQNQEKKQSKFLESLETIHSLNIENIQLNNIESPNSTRIFTEYIRDNDSQFSEVQNFQI